MCLTGYIVGYTFKAISGPSMNILIKLMSIVALIIAPHINANRTTIPHAEITPKVNVEQTVEVHTEKRL